MELITQGVWRRVAVVAQVVFVTSSYAQTGVVSTVVGSAGARGYSGDGGAASGALLRLANLLNPCDTNQYELTSQIAVDRAGNLLIADADNHRVRRITPQGVISTIAGTGESGTPVCSPTSAVNDGGPATAARLYGPGDIAIAPDDSIVIADQQNNRVRRIAPNGTISTIVGTGQHNLYAPILATLSPMDWPSAVAVAPDATIYFAEIHSNRVARIGADGRLVTVAGTGFPGFSGDNGAASSARLNNPTGLSIAADGSLYIADSANHRVRRVANGVITTVAGTGVPGYSGDNGPAVAASLNRPMDVHVDGASIYIADTNNHRVRRIDAAGVITTVAGDGQEGAGPDLVAPMSSSLRFPSSITTDKSGDLYIADWQNYRIRKVSARPSISLGGIVNGASFAPAPVPVAPGSIISLFGVNFAGSTLSAAGAPLPVNLGGTEVRVNGSAIPLFFVSTGQINAQLPYDIAAGAVSATVVTPAGESAAGAFIAGPASPGIFTVGATGRGIAVNESGVLNSPDARARAGEYLVVYLTGIGAVNPPVPTGEAAPALHHAVASNRATIGGVEATVSFLGLTPGFVGLAQANVLVPAGAPRGEAVPLLIHAGGQASNEVTVAIQ